MRGLKERIEEPMVKLLATQKNAMDGDRGREIQKNYDALVAQVIGIRPLG